VDTCFIIDASLSTEQGETIYAELRRILQEENNHLLSVYPVALEYLKGTNLISEFQSKKAFLDDLVETWLPVDVTTIEKAYDLAQIYRRFGKDVSSTDFVLGATLARYPNTYLLTKDHDDFPVRIFDRVSVLPMQHKNGGVDTYGLFKYSEDKAGGISKELLKIHKKKAGLAN